MPNRKGPPVPAPPSQNSSVGWFTFIVQFFRSLFRLFVSENRRREAQLERIRKIANLDHQEDDRDGRNGKDR